MWVVKEQSKKNPAGVVVSPVMQTQTGAQQICEMLQKQFDVAKPEADEPNHYYVAQHIKRGTK